MCQEIHRQLMYYIWFMENHFESSLGKISYDFFDKGHEKNLLLIHGFIEDREVWEKVVTPLHANLIVVDLLGFGKSVPQPDFDFSMKQQAASILELLDHLHIKEVYVLGHSMGGYITLELATLKPDIHIGLLHSTCLADTEEKKHNRNKTIGVLEREPAVFIREFYWSLFAEHHKDEFADVIEKLRLKAENIPVKYIIETVVGLRDRKNHLATWTKAEKHGLVVAGTYDKIFDVKELEKLVDKEKANWLELKDSGHMGLYEEPEVLTEEINDWLNPQ